MLPSDDLIPDDVVHVHLEGDDRLCAVKVIVRRPAEASGTLRIHQGAPLLSREKEAQRAQMRGCGGAVGVGFFGTICLNLGAVLAIFRVARNS